MAISEAACSVCSADCLRDRLSSSAATFPRSTQVRSPRPSVFSAMPTPSSGVRRTAAIGWSVCGAAPACRRPSPKFAGQARMLLPILSATSRDGVSLSPRLSATLISKTITAACAKAGSASSRLARAQSLRAWTSPPRLALEARHDLDEAARAVAIVELQFEDAVPAILAGSGRPWQAEDESAVGHATASSRLHRRGADGLEAHHVEQRREAVDLLLEQRLDRLRRHVALGKASASGGDDHIDLRILDPLLSLLADVLSVVRHDRSRRDLVAGLLDHRRKQ